MPLESYEDYVRLNEHLKEIEPMLEAFALRHGYTFTRPFEGGLYPCVGLHQAGAIHRSIKIEMEYENGRYDRFFPEVPYRMAGHAWIDEYDQRTRWLCPSIVFGSLPFCVLVEALPHHLVHFHNYVSQITEEYIRTCAWKWPLSARPTDIAGQ